jgi:hypothetical protein
MLVEPGVADAFPAQVSPYEPAVSLTQASKRNERRKAVRQKA